MMKAEFNLRSKQWGTALQEVLKYLSLVSDVASQGAQAWLSEGLPVKQETLKNAMVYLQSIVSAYFERLDGEIASMERAGKRARRCRKVRSRHACTLSLRVMQLRQQVYEGLRMTEAATGLSVQHPTVCKQLFEKAVDVSLLCY